MNVYSEIKQKLQNLSKNNNFFACLFLATVKSSNGFEYEIEVQGLQLSGVRLAMGETAEFLVTPKNGSTILGTDFHGGLKATHRGHNFDKKGGIYEKQVQNAGFKAGYAVVLEKEIHNVFNEKNCDGKWNGEFFEIKNAKTATPRNIRDSLKHCAKKPNCKIAVIYFENNFNKENFYKGLKMFEGLKGTSQYRDFEKIICIQGDEILFE